MRLVFFLVSVYVLFAVGCVVACCLCDLCSCLFVRLVLFWVTLYCGWFVICLLLVFVVDCVFDGLVVGLVTCGCVWFGLDRFACCF